MLELANGASHLVLCPETGGAVGQFSWRGRDILRPVTEQDLGSGNARRLGMFPLAPYSNRLPDGRLALGQQQWQLRLNCPGEAHSIHGVAWQRAFTVADAGRNAALLSLRHPGDADWPFRCRVEQRFRLGEDSLQVQLRLVNEDAVPMPAGLGFHPYFPRTPDTRLQVHWDGRWEMDGRKLPSRWQERAPADDFRSPRAIAGWSSDHCYTGWNGTATLDYGTHCVTVSADDACSRLVCFVPDDGRQLVALEPVTHVNNAFALAQQGVAATGMRLLLPGEEMTLEMRISLSASLPG